MPLRAADVLRYFRWLRDVTPYAIILFFDAILPDCPPFAAVTLISRQAARGGGVRVMRARAYAAARCVRKQESACAMISAAPHAALLLPARARRRVCFAIFTMPPTPLIFRHYATLLIDTSPIFASCR